MASVDWLKHTRQSIGGLKVHLDSYCRRTHTHSNTNIDVSKSWKNYYLGARTFGECMLKLDERVRQVDEQYPPKRRVKPTQRIVACTLEAVCPQAIADRGMSDDFFDNYYKTLQNFFGKENVIGCVVHKDEIHEYLDKSGAIKKSLEHAHAIVATYVEWIDNGKKRIGINGKNFETRPRYNLLNDAVDSMCLERYGISYRTHGEAEHLTVEALKERSNAIEKRQEYSELIKKHNELIDDIERLKDGAIDLAYELVQGYEVGRSMDLER